MKKLLSALLLSSLIVVPSLITVACSIGELSSHAYLSSLPDFDWSSDKGYDLEAPIADNKHKLTTQQMSEFNFQSINQKVIPNYNEAYFDYDIFDTNFKENPSLIKQATTGAPINKIYSAGNLWSDFGITSKARTSLRANTILEWDNPDDVDLKYAFSTEPLQHRTKTALKRVETQDERIAFGDIRDHSRVNGSYQNTNNGTKNPFEKSISSYQYRDYLFDWGQHGNVAPPAADMIEAGHVNGTPVYGLIFFDGYGGLTRDELKDFLEKNPDGTYKFVDILIDMCLELGFDGWFYNDESNGGWPNGTISPVDFAYDVVKQFDEKTRNHPDPRAHDLKIAYYRDGGNLKSIEDVPLFSDFARMSEYADIVQTDFRISPNDNKDYVASTNIDPTKVHSLVELAANYNYIGSFDWRYFIYGSEAGLNKIEYDYDTYQSISSFSGGGSGEYGSQAWQISNKEPGIDLNRYQDRVNGYVFSQQVSNMYEGFMFNGLNGNLTSNDTGTISYELQDPRDMILSDPRIETTLDLSPNSNVGDLYDYDKNDGLISKSYGLANVIQEYTTINDENLKTQKNIITNFSLGNGVEFTDRDQAGKITSKVSNYPWTNRRMTDLLPTYAFDIKETNNNDVIGVNKGINGYYDYYDGYKKGNSIAIASTLNLDGSIDPATWDTSKTYDWNIMGANLSQGSYDLSYVVKVSNEDGATADENDELKEIIDSTQIITTYTSDNKNAKIESIKPDKIEKLNDGWYRISTHVQATPAKQIAKFGLRINPKSNTYFKYNVGEFSLIANDVKLQQTQVNNAEVEAIVKRNDQQFNARINWLTNNDNADYYEIYYRYKNEWFRIGETTLQSMFFANLPNLPDQKNVEFGIRPISRYSNNKLINTFSFEI